MRSYYKLLICTLLCIAYTTSIVLAGSSTGTSPGFNTIPTTFEWEGDKRLNGESTGSFFSDDLSSDLTSGAGMVMYSTGGLATNNSTVMNGTSNQTAVNETEEEEDLLSGYDSLGDIIKASDWAALDKYTNGIKADSPIADSDFVINSDSNTRWDKKFKKPENPTISCGPC